MSDPGDETVSPERQYPSQAAKLANYTCAFVCDSLMLIVI